MQHSADNLTISSNSMEGSITADPNNFVTRQDIINFPFPYKLWLVVHLEFCDFLRWNRDGTVILLDLIALEDYLNSTRTIFKIKNRSVFLEHLEEFKFERLNATPEAEEDLLLQYKNENFQRFRLDLLGKIRRHTYQLLGVIEQNKNGNSNGNKNSSTTSSSAAAMAQSRVSYRMLGDLCFMSHGGLSNIQKSRLRFQTTLNFQNETRILQEKMQASDEHAAVQAQQRRFKSDVMARTGVAAAGAAADEEQVIELPVELFENPHDSVLHFEDFRPEYAGYYGNCSKDQIMHFFGDYLPMYEDGSMEVKKIVADACSMPNQSCIISDDAELLRDTMNDEFIKITSTPIQKHMAAQKSSMSALNLYSTLEPIFKTEDDEEQDEQNNNNSSSYVLSASNDIEAEISMEEFITFKNNSNNKSNMDSHEFAGLSIIENTDAKSKEFPQMPSAVKMEIADEEDSENEANFRNFFSQYRATLNLLYERH